MNYPFIDPVEAVLLIGPTGSGKTPLGDYIRQRGIHGRKCHHFDFGHELRTIAEEAAPAGGFSRDEHQFIIDVLEKALLLEDEHFPVAEKIVLNFMSARGCGASDLIILNGLPRHSGQARDMERLVGVTRVLVLECGADDVCTRIERNTGGDRACRTDDAEEMIRKKIALYHQRTAPLIAYYAGKGCSLVHVRVDAASTAESVYAQFLSLLSFRSFCPGSPKRL
jgi:adenylate kinase family enzyme